jgi:PsbP-like protein
LYKVIGVILILFFIIGSSGCTYKDSTPSREKKYMGKGVSFSYPPEYEVKEVENRSGVFIVGQSGWDSNYTFQISKESLDNSKVNGLSLNSSKYAQKIKNKGFNLEEIQNITINGVKGFEIIYSRYDPPYVKYEMMVFEKNKRITLLFEYKGIGVTDTRATPAISNSFKVLN